MKKLLAAEIAMLYNEGKGICMESTANSNEAPIATPANVELRDARRRAHTAFDSLWRGMPPRGDQFISSDVALKWLKEHMKKIGFNLENEYPGILQVLDLVECNEIIHIIDQRTHSQFAEEIVTAFGDWGMENKEDNPDDYQDIPCE